jgi:AcrR family transcriptional regulator
VATDPKSRTPLAPAQERGRSTRYRIIEQTARLYAQRPGAEPSVAQIAAAAGVFPNQVTYYFGSKDSLLVHAAFLGLLHDAEAIESVGFRAADAASFRAEIAQAVLAMPSLPSVASALAAGVSRPALAPVVDKHLDLLLRQSARYLRRLMRERGWGLTRTPEIESRTFWSTALGAVLLARAGSGGSAADLDLAGTLTVRENSESHHPL